MAGVVDPRLKQHMAYWEEELGKSEWFCGNEFTAADVQMSFPLEAAAARFVEYWNGAGTWHSLAAEHRARVTARIVPVARHFEAVSLPLSLDHWRGLSPATVVLRGDRSPAPARAASERFAA